MSIDKNLLKQLRPEIDAALRKVAEAHGLSFIGVGTMRFDSGRFGCRLEMTSKEAYVIPTVHVDASGGVKGFPFKVGEAFRMGPRATYTVVSFTSRGTPIATNTNGTRYKIPPRSWSACVPA